MTVKKRQNAEVRKPAILKAFYEVIDSEGFENASVAKVAKKAEVHPSLIIHYFGTKENMVVELVDDVLRTYAKLFENTPSTGTAQERLDRLLNLIWSQEWYEAANFSAVFSFLALSQRHHDVKIHVLRLYDKFKTFIIAQLSAFSEAGVINIDDPESASEILISMSEGSHYFCQFFTTEDEFKTHREKMIKAAKKVLGYI